MWSSRIQMVFSYSGFTSIAAQRLFEVIALFAVIFMYKWVKWRYLILLTL